MAVAEKTSWTIANGKVVSLGTYVFDGRSPGKPQRVRILEGGSSPQYVYVKKDTSVEAKSSIRSTGELYGTEKEALEAGRKQIFETLVARNRQVKQLENKLTDINTRIANAK